VVGYDTRARERSLVSCSGGSCRFGLRTSKVGFANINAKAEGIEGRPALREAFQPPRSLVPVARGEGSRLPRGGSGAVGAGGRGERLFR
jgi:hypothetical protein